METVIYSFDKEALFNRCGVDVITYGKDLENADEMCEHDRDWFEVALYAASCVVVHELGRIAKSVDYPIVDDAYSVNFQTLPTSLMQKQLLPNVIEQYLISHVVNLWYMQKHRTNMLDVSSVLSQLKHVTLMNNNVKRKPSY